jgi:hypothetical protein
MLTAAAYIPSKGCQALVIGIFSSGPSQSFAQFVYLLLESWFLSPIIYGLGHPGGFKSLENSEKRARGSGLAMQHSTYYSKISVSTCESCVLKFDLFKRSDRFNPPPTRTHGGQSVPDVPNSLP